MDSLLDDIKTLSISDSESIITDYYDNSQRQSNPLYHKLVPIEVSNYYCKDYFDDEDFIFMTLELPYDLMDDIMNDGNNSITEYFYSFMNNIEISDDDSEEQLYYSLYDNCIKVYDTILQYYSPSWYGNETRHDQDDYSKFNIEWITSCNTILSNMDYILSLGFKDESLEYLCTYNKEVYAGLYIIMSRIESLFNFFQDKDSLQDFYNEEHDYRQTTIRIINNLCVILLYLKFYYLKNGYSYNKEIIPNKDSMITLEE